MGSPQHLLHLSFACYYPLGSEYLSLDVSINDINYDNSPYVIPNNKLPLSLPSSLACFAIHLMTFSLKSVHN